MQKQADSLSYPSSVKMNSLSFILLLMLLPFAVCSDNEECSIKVSTPGVVLTDVPFVVTINLPPFLPNNETIPEEVCFSLEGADYEDINCTRTRNINGTSLLTLLLNETTVDYLGYHILTFNFSRSTDTGDPHQLICPSQEQTLLAIPGILTLIAPIVTAVLAIAFRQIILALIVGIWICASFANEYNPLAGIVRALDQYFVGSFVAPGHAAIIVFTLFLGGLIGVVQKSGGGIGLARLLYRFTNSRRKATVVCVVLCFLIFFDDYSAVLIPGNSLRSVMSTAGVSREKFAFILQSVGPALASIVPISSWIGVEVGYVHSAFSSAVCGGCPANSTTDDFVLVVETIPYRFFPLLLLFCVVLVSVLGRDFGPMLTAEKPPLPSSDTPPNEINGRGKDRDDEEEGAVHEMRGRAVSEVKEKDEDAYSGPLAPKKGVPYRWFNAAVPFLITVFVTLIGMVLGGREAILNQPEEERVSMTVVNIFTMADSVNALIWASSLASVVLLVMLRVQKILLLKEFMEAWIEGIKDVLEPLLILLLAWSLGAAIQDIHTNSYIAQGLKSGGVSVDYIPTIVTIIGFVLAFATGSAFGTMGLLFPLVIPTVCQLAPCQQGPALQATAAIFSSSLFGNAISPIADITILTTVASQCELVPHIKTAAPYVFLVGLIALLFGALPVGAGWYPWYGAWLIMPFLLSLVFVIFSSSFTSEKSRSLCRIVFPCLYTIPDRLFEHMKVKFVALKTSCCVKLRRRNESNFSTDGAGTGTQIVTETTSLLSREGRPGRLRSRPSLTSSDDDSEEDDKDKISAAV